MANIEVTFSAVSIPTNSSIDLTVFEDTDSDGAAENTATTALSDATTSYTLSGFDVTAGNSFAFLLEHEGFDGSSVTAPITIQEGPAEETANVTPLVFTASDLQSAGTSQTTGNVVINTLSATDKTATIDSSVSISALAETLASTDLTGTPTTDSTVTANEQSVLYTPLTPAGTGETSGVGGQTAVSFTDVLQQSSASSTSVTVIETFDATTLNTQNTATSTPTLTPEQFSLSGLQGTLQNKSVVISAQDTSVVVTPLTPTLSLVINVGVGDIGLESAFADSLTAFGGANTSLTVAKTIATTTVLGNSSSSSTSSVTPTDVLATILTESSSESTPLIDETEASFTQLLTDSSSEAVPLALKITAAISAVEGTLTSKETTVDALAQSAATLANTGIVQSETEAALLVTAVSMTDALDESIASSQTGGETIDVATTRLTGRPEGIASGVSEVQTIDTTIRGRSSSSSLDTSETQTAGYTPIGNSSTEAVVNALFGTLTFLDQSVVPKLFYLNNPVSKTGGNDYRVESGQNIDVRNSPNSYKVQ